jgi:para-aminobenzoate N-oxygenase AurF
MTDVAETGNEAGARLRERAVRLIKASARNSYDPLVDIDWDAGFEEGRYFMMPERMSLYGTAIWAEMSEQQRIELSKHELARAWAVGMWFELILCEMLMRWAYELDPRDPRTQYILVEIGDETRHSHMFARTIVRLGTPHYGPHRLSKALGRIYAATARGAALLAPTLVGEEIPDRFQRELMNDERMQPLTRTAARIHVVEEARHIQFARAELTDRLRKSSGLGRVVSNLVTALISAMMVIELGAPRRDIYRNVGLDANRALRESVRNLRQSSNVEWAVRKVRPMLAEAGMLTWYTRPIYRRLGIQ